jgi:hypothetical protein
VPRLFMLNVPGLKVASDWAAVQDRLSTGNAPRVRTQSARATSSGRGDLGGRATVPPDRAQSRPVEAINPPTKGTT